MADLSFMHEVIPTSVEAVNLWYEAQRKPRNYLGLSQAGHDCARYLWYVHNGYAGKPIEGRVLRLFQLGNLLEDQVVADLRACGFLISCQQGEVKFSQGAVRLVGHIDGVIEGLLESPKTPHLFECKSASKKKFDELLKAGSYAKWNSIYGWQVQFYMLGLDLKRAAAFIYCKDDSRFHLERIKLEKQAAIDRLGFVFESITSSVEPERISNRADNYKCKWCDYYEQCFGQKVVATNKGADPWN